MKKRFSWKNEQELYRRDWDEGEDYCSRSREQHLQKPSDWTLEELTEDQCSERTKGSIV